jgi:hypothetical protein
LTKKKRKKKAENLEPWLYCQVFWKKYCEWKGFKNKHLTIGAILFSKPGGLELYSIIALAGGRLLNLLVFLF